MTNKKIYFLVFSFAIVLILAIIFFNNYNANNSNNQNIKGLKIIENLNSNTSINKENNSIIANSSTQKYNIDYAGAIITQTLKNKLHLNLGFIWSDNLLAANQPLPVEIDSLRKDLTSEELSDLKYPINQVRLADLVPVPSNIEKTNWLSYPKFQTEAPIMNSSFQDFFESDNKGIVDFDKPIEEKQEDIDKGNYQSVPIQKLLAQGVVHLAISPAPGELGQSYIVGHSSNYSKVKSDYNYIFASMEGKSQPGDEFFIFDQFGRKLKFKVFEAKEISEEDVVEAYKQYPDKRAVTLQGSILENINGILKPTKRWLTRGELSL